jgi:hypothetical protein
MAEPNQAMGLFDGISKSMTSIVGAQGKLIEKSFDMQSAIMDSMNKNAIGILDTFGKKVNEALGGVWTGFGSK